MPLEKSTSKEAFGHNIGAELKAGKPQKQAEAIAFAEKRAAMGKKMSKQAKHYHHIANHEKKGFKG